MDTTMSPAITAPKDPATRLLEDLAVLCDGPAMELRIAFDGALISMRSHDRLVWQDSADVRWMRQNAKARAAMLSGWIHMAAEKYRGLPSSSGRRSKKGVA